MMFEMPVKHVRYISFPVEANFIRKNFETKYKDKSNIWKIIYASLATTFTPGVAFAQDGNISKLTTGFEKIYDLLTTISQPILMVFFVYGFILYAMENESKKKGLGKIKAASVAYIGITMLPGILKLLHWVGIMLRDSVNF